MADTDDRWKNDWFAFTEVLQKQIENGATPADVAEFFSGCDVRWTGIVREIRFDESLSSVALSMPERIINLLDGSRIHLDRLSLHVARASMDQWQSVTVGDEVSFTASLGQEGSPFPAVKLKLLKGVRPLIMIGLSNALPV